MSGKGLALFASTVGGWVFGTRLIRSLGTVHSVQKIMMSSSKDTADRKKSTLYTRTGDKGTTSLYSGERRPKSDPIFECLGHQDELNAILGIACEYCKTTDNGLEDMVMEIQSRLFDLGAAIATPIETSSNEKRAYTKFSAEHTAVLEEWIDELDARLPPITNFVIPSGGLSATHLNLARTVCRRAERAVIPLIKEGQVDIEVGKYLNRLSDFLFAATRTASYKEGVKEKLWRPTTQKTLEK